jgi:thiamine biosynthesis lipoprotein
MHKNVFNNNFAAMGTRFGIVLPGTGNAHGELVTHLIKDEIERIEGCISRFIPSSKISFLNKYASHNPSLVDEELFNLLVMCKEFHESTGGACDITLHAIADYWNKIDTEKESFNNKALTELLHSAGMDKINLIEENKSVFFKHPGLQLDFGSVGKGIALERVKKILVDNEIDCAFVSFGESSILTHGSHPNGEMWKIGIPSELNRNENVYIIDVKDYSISTSGNTANNSIKGRVNIVSPFTGYPVRERKTILVAHPDPITAEALSTAFMVLPDEKISAIISGYPDAEAAKIEYPDKGKPVITEFQSHLTLNHS